MPTPMNDLNFDRDREPEYPIKGQSISPDGRYDVQFLDVSKIDVDYHGDNYLELRFITIAASASLYLQREFSEIFYWNNNKAMGRLINVCKAAWGIHALTQMIQEGLPPVQLAEKFLKEFVRTQNFAAVESCAIHNIQEQYRGIIGKYVVPDHKWLIISCNRDDVDNFMLDDQPKYKITCDNCDP